MAITTTNILTYIFANRLTSSYDSKYLLEGNTVKGADAVNSALFWMNARFKNAGYGLFFRTWKDYLFGFTTDDLVSLQTVQDAFYGIDEDLYLDYAELFEALILISIYNLYSGTEQELIAKDKEDRAKEIISGIIGQSAFPGEAVGETRKTPPVFCVDTHTEDEREDEALGIKVGYQGDE